MPHATPLLIEQCRHQMRRLDELVVPTHSQALGIRQGHLEFTGQFIHSHCVAPVFIEFSLIWGGASNYSSYIFKISILILCSQLQIIRNLQKKHLALASRM